MAKKILRWFLWLLGVVAGLLVLLAVLAYVPAVQQWAKERAVRAISSATGMRLGIERFRLRFPLTATFDNVFLITESGDTLLRAERLGTGVSLRPLFRKQVNIPRLDLRGASVHYADTLSGITLRASLDRLTLRSGNMTFGTRAVDLSALSLSRARVDLTLGENRKPEKADTLRWTFRLRRLDLDSVDFRMRTPARQTELAAGLLHGELRSADIDLEQQLFAVGEIALEQGIFAFGALTGAPKPGFDPEHLQVDSIALLAGSFRYRGRELSVDLLRLTARERSGLAVTEGEGRFAMDSTGLTLSGFSIRTAHSSLHADASVGDGLFARNPDAPVSAILQADIDPAELALFYAPDPALHRILGEKRLRIDGNVSGTLSRLTIHALHAILPDHIDLRADGTVTNLTGRAGGNLHLNGALTRLDDLRPLLPESLRPRIGFPARMTLAGSVAIADPVYTPDLRITADSGEIVLRGRLDRQRQAYRADLTVRGFPLGTFLPHDSLGAVSLALTAEGVRFDPRQEGAAAGVDLRIDRFDYRKYTFHDLHLAAKLHEHAVNGTLVSASEAARMKLDLTGELRPENYAVRLAGAVDTLDLYRLGFSPEPLRAGFVFDGQATVSPDTLWRGRVELTIDTIRWEHRARVDLLGKSTLTASAEPGRVTVAVRNGDLTLDFNTPVPVDSLPARLSRAGRLIAARIDSVRIDPASIEEALPPLRIDASAGGNNFLRLWLESRGIDFRSLNLMASNPGAGRPLQAFAVIDGLQTGKLTLDTLTVGAYREEEQLNWFLRLSNRPGNIEQLTLLAAMGTLTRNRATADITQRNRADSTGFAFGLEAERIDGAIRLRMTPEEPLLGYVAWTVNPDNYLIWRFDRSLEANFHLEGPGGRHLYLASAPLLPSLPTGAVRLDTRGIDIGHMLELLPNPPPIDGSLHTALGFGFDRGQFVAGGTVAVDSLMYRSNRVGNVGLDLDFQSDSLNRFTLDATASFNGQPVLKADGTYLNSDGSLAVRAALAELPLASANAFLPKETIRLDGSLTGTLTATGPAKSPQLNGQLTFNAARTAFPMTGTAFTLSDGPIRIDGGRIAFDRFRLISPDNQALAIDGTVDFADLSRPTVDLTLSARNFDAVNTPRGGASPVTGKALIDADATVRGRLNAPTVRGRIGLLNGTDITYTAPQGPRKIESRHQEFVRFVDFNDPGAFEPDTAARPTGKFGMDMLVGIDIDERVRATVNVSADGTNRGEVTGGGSLTYTMNTQGDSRFTGRYAIRSGTVVYHPPVIASKSFTVAPDSYVEWTGELRDPVFNIRADETLRTTVKTDGNNAGRPVSFLVSILIRNSLKNVELSFDLSAPGDPDIGYQLSSLAPEQRSQQALALLVYNTYTGPGTTATANAANPLNSFLARELNQWTRDNLPGVDVSFGIDSGKDAAGGTHTDYSYRVSKRFMDDRISVSVGGSVGSDSEQNARNNFVDDISVEYRLTDRDNLFLKAFRHNARLSILEGEVVETGGGILLRKKMNRMNELFKLAPKEERRQRRAQRKQLKANNQHSDEVAR